MKEVIKEYWWYYAILGVVALGGLLVISAATYNSFIRPTAEDGLDAYCHSTGKGDADINLGKAGDAIGSWYCTNSNE